MRFAVAQAVARLIVAGGTADCDAEGGCIPECLVESLQGLAGPGRLGRAPADREDQGRAALVVYRGGDRIEKAPNLLASRDSARICDSRSLAFWQRAGEVLQRVHQV